VWGKAVALPCLEPPTRLRIVPLCWFAGAVLPKLTASSSWMSAVRASTWGLVPIRTSRKRHCGSIALRAALLSECALKAFSRRNPSKLTEASEGIRCNARQSSSIAKKSPLLPLMSKCARTAVTALCWPSYLVSVVTHLAKRFTIRETFALLRHGAEGSAHFSHSAVQASPR
jgi:hypothetical protein